MRIEKKEVPKEFLKSKKLTEALKREIIILYELGLEDYEIRYILYLKGKKL